MGPGWPELREGVMMTREDILFKKELRTSRYETILYGPSLSYQLLGGARVTLEQKKITNQKKEKEEEGWCRQEKM